MRTRRSPRRSPTTRSAARAGGSRWSGCAAQARPPSARQRRTRSEVPFFELDREIERLSGTSLGSILELYGQQAYRRYELQALQELLAAQPRFIVATGGSLVSETATYELLLRSCFTVWVRTTPEEHMQRVLAQGDLRPMAGIRSRRWTTSAGSSTNAASSTAAPIATSTRPASRVDRSRSGSCLEANTGIIIPTRCFGVRMITFDRDPATYQHWRLTFDGPVATLTLDVNEDGGIDEGYKLKLNSYDLGVDIELRDALHRIRFEHPEVGAVVIASGKERMFCAGANIYMLGKATHAFKVNFCKFTNETRNGIEDSSRALRPQVPGRGERHRRRRRLRAGAGLRRDRARRRPLVARSASPRCRCSACCRARAA